MSEMQRLELKEKEAEDSAERQTFESRRSVCSKSTPAKRELEGT